MRQIFLGKPVHWAIIVLLVLGGWLTGRARLHVIEFNTFVICLLAVTVLVILAVLATTRPDEQVTRDPVEPEGEG